MKAVLPVRILFFFLVLTEGSHQFFSGNAHIPLKPYTALGIGSQHLQQTVTTVGQDCVLYNIDGNVCYGNQKYNATYQTSCSVCQSGIGFEVGCTSFTWKGHKSCSATTTTEKPTATNLRTTPSAKLVTTTTTEKPAGSSFTGNSDHPKTVTTIGEDCVLYNSDGYVCFGNHICNASYQISCSVCQSGTVLELGCISFTWKGRTSCPSYPTRSLTQHPTRITVPSFILPLSENRSSTMPITKLARTTNPTRKPVEKRSSTLPMTKLARTTNPSMKPVGSLVWCDSNCSPSPDSCEISTGRCFLCVSGYFPSFSGICLADPRSGLTSFQLAMANMCPIIYWRMEQSVSPAYSYALNPVVNVVAKYTVSGYFQLATALDLTQSQYVYMHYLAPVNPASFTVMFWANVKGSGMQTAISSVNSYAFGSYGYIVYCDTSNTWKVDLSQHGLLPEFVTFDSFVSCKTKSYTFIALTINKEASSVNFYVNGKLVLNQTLHSFTPNNGNAFVIGGRMKNTESSIDCILDGAIDEVAIFSYVVPSSIILLLYSLGITPDSGALYQNVAFSISFNSDFSSNFSLSLKKYVIAGMSSIFQLQPDQITLQVTNVRRRLMATNSQTFHFLFTALTPPQVYSAEITLMCSSDCTSNIILTLLQNLGINASLIHISQRTIYTTPQANYNSASVSKLLWWIVIGIFTPTALVAFLTALSALKKHFKSNKRKQTVFAASPTAATPPEVIVSSIMEMDASYGSKQDKGGYDDSKRNIMQDIVSGSEKNYKCRAI